ncbi:MAG: hypothetical protein LBE18_07215, partial [Planctomycetaceae bacterium]|nr:hypothetical protein [Planctomycetaceae bacterium]
MTFLLVTIDTIETLDGHPIGWNEWSALGQSFQDSTVTGTLLNAGRAGLSGLSLGTSEITIGTYNYFQDSDADNFQQHIGGVAAGNLLAAASAKISGVNPKFEIFKNGKQTTVPANVRNCFLAGTLVSKYSEGGINNNEFVPIEQIKFGDKVWSFNFGDQRWEVKPVIQTFRTNYDGDIVTINIGDNIIHSTGGHPFWVIE